MMGITMEEGHESVSVEEPLVFGFSMVQAR